MLVLTPLTKREQAGANAPARLSLLDCGLVRSEAVVAALS